MPKSPDHSAVSGRSQPLDTKVLQGPTSRWTTLLLFLLGAALLLPVASSEAADLRRRLADGSQARLTDKQEIFLEVAPRRGEGLLSFARRVTGSTRNAKAISNANGRPRRLLVGVRYRVPYSLLSNDYRLQVIQALFPDDGPSSGGWRHRIDRRTRGQSLWHVALWFTGRGENYRALRKHNGLRSNTVHPGQVLEVPRRLLLPAFASESPRPVPQEPPPVVAESSPPVGNGSQQPSGAAAPPVAAPPSQAEPSPPRARLATDGLLEYEQVNGQQYGVYRLARGEALYSSVVVRFTGRTFAEDVNGLAAEIAQLNGIADVTDIPVGRRIRIPLDHLLPQYLPSDNPRRLEYERAKAESAQFSNPVRAARLQGITVILDAGHGGADPGASIQGVWESVYVYDIMVRVKDLLEGTTAANVVPTIRDGKQFRVVDRDVLPRSRGHAILTNPAYPIETAAVGTNLRWYLANSVHRRALAQHGDDARVIFVSIHADSLHPSLRGAMVYVPGASLRRGEYGKSGSVYNARTEVRQRPRVSFTWKQRVRSEGLSRQLAQRLMSSFRRHRLPVHPQQAVRDRIVRSKRWVYVPAVLRYNAVPAKVLLEVGNLNNTQDRRLLQTRDFRQKVAQVIVDGIVDYYGEEASDGNRVASKAR